MNSPLDGILEKTAAYSGRRFSKGPDPLQVLFYARGPALTLGHWPASDGKQLGLPAASFPLQQEHSQKL